MYMSVLPECMCVHHLHASCPRKSEEGVRSPGTGLIDGYELSCESGVEPGFSESAVSAAETLST